MQISVATTTIADTGAAAADLGARLRRELGGPPDIAFLHLGTVHEPAGAARALIRAAGAGRLHGATSCLGVMSEEGPAIAGGAGMGCLAIRDPAGEYGTGAAALGDDPSAAARRATLCALEAAGRPGEAPALVWLTASPGVEEALLAGIQEVTGAGTPVVGGSAADNAVAGQWRVVHGSEALEGAVVVSVLFPSTAVSHAFQSGYAPTAHSGTVTAAAGRRLLALDGRPAAEVYAGWTRGAVPAAADAGPVNILSEATLHPLGLEAGEIRDVRTYRLAHPAAAHPDGSLELFADVAEGDELCLMTGSVDSLVARAERVARLARSTLPEPGRPPAGALMIYCGGCMLAVRDRMDEVAAGVARTLEAPFLGLFSFGEQGPLPGSGNCHANLMISCVAFAAGEADERVARDG